MCFGISKPHDNKRKECISILYVLFVYGGLRKLIYMKFPLEDKGYYHI